MRAATRCPSRCPIPDRLGHWPAAAGFFAFAICELCWAAAKDPAPLAILMLVYLAIQLVGMSLYGVEPWTRRGDAFGVWFGLLARLAPFGRRADGRLVLRPAGASAATRGSSASRARPRCCWSRSARPAFDGAKEGPLFNDVVGDLQDAVHRPRALARLRARARVRRRASSISIAVVSAIWAIGVLGMPRRALRLSRRELGRRFVHTLIPIAAAYLVAHYFSALAYDGQDAVGARVRSARRRLGPVRRRRQRDRLLGRLGDRIWYVQVAALVIGHVAALVLAHDRALHVYGSPRAAIASQVVMLVVMVLFTLLGLWLLSEALNQ